MRNSNVVVTLTVACGLAVGGCGRPPQQAAMPPPGPPEVAVVVVKAERTEITAELPGRTSAYLVAQVRPQVGGIIQKRMFEEGADVNAGDVLYQIDPSLYQAAFDRTKAELARAEAHIIPVRFKFERYTTLVKSKAVSQQEFDDISSELGKAEAEIGIAKAALETARINLEYTRVTAPISGRIGKSLVTVGSLVSANHILPLAVIQQLDPIYVDVTQSSANLLRLKHEILNGLITTDGDAKTKVKLLLEDGTPYSHEGTLKFRDVTVDQNTGSFILRIVFPNPEYVLLPGMFARAIVREGVVEQGILVPQQGVTRDMKGSPIAMVVDSGDKVERRTLEIDRAMGNKWLIKDGLKPGDRLIVEGFQRIKPGVPVKVVPFDAPVTAAAPGGAAEPAKAGN